MSTNQIQAIDANIKAARKLVELGDALERLKSNKDFQAVIMTGYFEQEAIRLVQAKSNPSLQSADMQKSIITQIDAIGNLNLYFQTVMQQASLGRKNIEQDEAMRDEILAEEA
jgi:hypothetical protein